MVYAVAVLRKRQHVQLLHREMLVEAVVQRPAAQSPVVPNFEMWHRLPGLFHDAEFLSQLRLPHHSDLVPGVAEPPHVHAKAVGWDRAHLRIRDRVGVGCGLVPERLQRPGQK